MTESRWESRAEPSRRTDQAFARAAADPDYDLVVRVRDGNLHAFGALVEKYNQPIVNFAARTLGDPMEAQDVAQNAFVRVFKESGRFRFACRFSTWLYTITRNLCLNELRRRARFQCDNAGSEEIEQPELARWEWQATHHGHGPETVFQRELQEKIEQALALLPERERTAILLLQEEDLSYADVAAILGTSLAATKTLIHRGRQALKTVLRPYLRSGAWNESWAEAFAQ